MADIPKTLCSTCNRVTHLRCKACINNPYCSNACKKYDKPIHRLICQAYEWFDFTDRPSPNHHLGILFPEDSPNPQLIWIQFTWTPDGHRFAEHAPHLAAVADDIGAPVITLDWNGTLDRPIRTTICVKYRGSCMSDGSKVNQAVKSLSVDRYTTVRYGWRGPVMAYGFIDDGPNPQLPCDLMSPAFGDLADFFWHYKG